MLSRPKRRYLRSNAVRSCSILFPSASLPCDALNISEGGARLKLLAEGASLPSLFLLFFSASEPIRNCRLVWRQGSCIGIQFLD
jgi:hypothetical protein